MMFANAADLCEYCAPKEDSDVLSVEVVRYRNANGRGTNWIMDWMTTGHAAKMEVPKHYARSFREALATLIELHKL